jgi:excisionase family DNA binding protein
MNESQISDFLSVREAAERVQVAEPTIRRWISECGLPAAKLGGRRPVIRIRVDALDEWVRRQEDA